MVNSAQSYLGFVLREDGLFGLSMLESASAAIRALPISLRTSFLPLKGNAAIESRLSKTYTQLG